MGNTARNFFTREEEKAVMMAIARAELDTSGEIRVHIDNECKGEVLDRAASVFEKLGMVNTRERNGVLFYLAVKPHKFAIIGDAGINTKVPADFWDGIKMHMLNRFSKGAVAQGLMEGIEMAGKELKAHFPWQKNDENELPNDISFGQ
ncbi:MAG: TPM domain-containing protein [Bacteroidales bacterium]|nr:TPM domain-containing protein [Bacteroidales bacterium]